MFPIITVIVTFLEAESSDSTAFWRGLVYPALGSACCSQLASFPLGFQDCSGTPAQPSGVERPARNSHLKQENSEGHSKHKRSLYRIVISTDFLDLT